LCAAIVCCAVDDDLVVDDDGVFLVIVVVVIGVVDGFFMRTCPRGLEKARSKRERACCALYGTMVGQLILNASIVRILQ
jgi:hypothetical protein